MKGGLGLLAGVLCMIAIACASASQKQGAQSGMTPSAPQTATELPKPASPQDDQIEQLAQDIETRRVELGLPAPAGCAGAGCARNALPMAGGGSGEVCNPAPTDTCKQTCTLSDSICGNAKKICEIANQLVGDQWAAKKCADGNTTCSAARSQCCECTR